MLGNEDEVAAPIRKQSLLARYDDITSYSSINLSVIKNIIIINYFKLIISTLRLLKIRFGHILLSRGSLNFSRYTLML